MPSTFDAAAATKIAKLCTDPITANPQEAGLRACFAAYQRERSEFPTDEAAWQFYGSSRQRFYEWNRQVKELMSDDVLETLLRSELEREQDEETTVKYVDGDIRATGTVYAHAFVPTGAFPPSVPPSPPASRTPSEGSEFEYMPTQSELARSKEEIRALQAQVAQYEKQQCLLRNQVKVMAAYNANPQGNEVHEAMRFIQASARQHLAHKHLLGALRAATFLQAKARSCIVRKGFALSRKSAVGIQAVQRRHQATVKYNTARRAIRRIQSRYRVVTYLRAKMPRDTLMSLTPTCSKPSLLAIIKAKEDRVARYAASLTAKETAWQAERAKLLARVADLQASIQEKDAALRVSAEAAEAVPDLTNVAVQLIGSQYALLDEVIKCATPDFAALPRGCSLSAFTKFHSQLQLRMKCAVRIWQSEGLCNTVFRNTLEPALQANDLLNTAYNALVSRALAFAPMSSQQQEQHQPPLLLPAVVSISPAVASPVAVAG